MPFLLLVVCVLNEPPEECEKLLRARASVRACDVTWSAETFDGSISGPTTYRFRRTPNGDALFEIRGDSDGVTLRDSVGEPLSRFPRLLLHNEEGYWMTNETSPKAYFAPPDSTDVWLLDFSEFQDVLQMGLGIATEQVEFLGGKHDGGQWKVERLENQKLVRLTVRVEGVGEYGWDLDPRKDWNAARVWLDTKLGLRESLVELEQFGKVWFPVRVTTFRDGVAVGRSEVKSAEFDESRLPNTLPVSALGLEPGCNVVWRESPRPGDPSYGRGYAIWNGEQPVSVQQWDKEVRSGKSAPSRRIQEAVVRGWVDSPHLTEEQREQARVRARDRIQTASMQVPTSGWETYVKNFIIRYDLDEEQSQRAYQILKQCQEQGERRLESKRDEIKKLNDELFEASQALDKQRSRELEQKLSTALEPLDEIFEKQLKPALDKLPTREQRRKAEGPASRPAASRPVSD